MKSAAVLVVLFLAVVLPVSCDQAVNPHAWMPQGRFGKRTLEQNKESAAIRALLSGKCYIIYFKIFDVILVIT